MRSRPMIRRSRPPRLAACLAIALALALTLPAGDAGAAETRPAWAMDRAAFTSACSGASTLLESHPCRRQAGPGPADRDVHPFDGALGRPCAYRLRETPSGPRKVRVCF